MYFMSTLVSPSPPFQVLVEGAITCLEDLCDVEGPEELVRLLTDIGRVMFGMPNAMRKGR